MDVLEIFERYSRDVLEIFVIVVFQRFCVTTAMQGTRVSCETSCATAQRRTVQAGGRHQFGTHILCSTTLP